MRKIRCLLSIFMAILSEVTAIVASGRDLVLTPKQALQLSGKRIYYGEEERDQTKWATVGRPWERTLKHVTYVTLFTDAALGAAAGNLSQLHDYHDFLQTPYSVPAGIPRTSASSRFGDIVTLASGRLEKLSSNGSYRFVEGLNADAASRNWETRALWRVQRIRHRDGDREGSNPRLPQRYDYELKFSVSPMGVGRWPPQSFIQRESDYPQSFGQLYKEKEQALLRAERRQDRQPQATFVRGIFQPPPNLNIGEYLKNNPQLPEPSKLDPFPGLYNLGLRPNFIPATTFRPSYPPMLKYGPRPQPFPLPNDAVPDAATAAPASAAAPAAVDPLGTPPVTHHFHHHFYMTGEGGNNPDLTYRPNYGPELANPAPAETTPPDRHHHHGQHGHHGHPHQQQQLEHHREVQFPAAESEESLEPGEEDVHQQHLQHHQQQQLRQHLQHHHQQQQQQHLQQHQYPHQYPPQIYTGYESTSHKYQISKPSQPLLIYAGAGQDVEAQKSFVQSEPLEETIYRYSEPDPLYVHQHPVDVLQLETPQEEDEVERQQTGHRAQEQEQEREQERDQERDQEREQERDQESEQEEHQQAEEQRLPGTEPEQRPAGSQKQHKLATTAATTGTTTTDGTTTTSTAATTTSTMGTTTTTTRATTPTTSRSSFVSTSTNFTPLRALSRYRTTPRITAGRSTTTTTTTELPAVRKWKLRRKDNGSSVDNKAKSSYRHESKVAFVPGTTTTTTTTTTAATLTTTAAATAATTAATTATAAATSSTTPATPPTTPPTTTTTPANHTALGEVIEVLTQKSVSKSVSIKVGANGEEIPIIIDDVENEVKHS